MDIFDPLDDSLTYLWLRDNELATLPADLLDGLTGLVIVTLSGNQLTNTIPAGVFADQGDLRILTLYDNNITSPPATLFAPFDGDLEGLYFRGNGITSLAETIFDGLDGLQELDLSENGLTTLPTDVFDGLDDSLTRLRLRSNSLTALNADIFDGLDGLQELDLSENGLTTLPTDVFDPLDDSLTHLWLQSNSLTALNADIFDGLTDLQRLDLSDNSLSALPTGVFDDLDDSLETLYLRTNSLTALPAAIFGDTTTGLTGLQYLDLSCNSLTALDLTATSPLNPFAGTLIYLDVGANSFSPALTDAAVRAKLTALEHLYLTGTAPCQAPTDTGLSALTVSEGTLVPPFAAPGVDEYSVEVGRDVSAIDIVPAPKDPNASIELINASQDTDPNATGFQAPVRHGRDGRNSVRWRVVAKDGVTKHEYTVRVFREFPPADEARLRSLELSGITLAPQFQSRTFTYTASVSNATAQTTVTPRLSDPDATAVIKRNGVVDCRRHGQPHRRFQHHHRRGHRRGRDYNSHLHRYHHARGGHGCSAALPFIERTHADPGLLPGEDFLYSRCRRRRLVHEGDSRHQSPQRHEGGQAERHGRRRR